ncbi:hypothetical protein [Nocardia yunnanensis]|uniref:hypothetical protein n=1 Tax=Nocardia yunnanensis TaxID=2382165 RepID=UPI0013C44731|nr:hypothetical protein [Nocardia yunnanensis]
MAFPIALAATERRKGNPILSDSDETRMNKFDTQAHDPQTPGIRAGAPAPALNSGQTRL